MGTANWQPKWWTEGNASAWGKVKESLKRDWEQTKKDLHLGGRELDQNVTDTLKQAGGQEAIPGANTPNTAGTPGRDLPLPHGMSTDKVDLGSWDDNEEPMRYGYAARKQYGDAKWDDNLETRLKSDWEGAGDTIHRKWEDVKNVVRHGYDRAHS